MKAIRQLDGFWMVGIVLLMIQVWSPSILLSGDGPCHVHNVHILDELLTHGKDSFFARFYTINTNPQANWLSHGILLALMQFFSAAISEKILVSVILFLFLGGSYLWAQGFHSVKKGILPGIFMLVCQITLARGFYNFSIGVALFPWFLWAHQKFQQEGHWKNGFVLTIISLILFLAHPVAYALSVLTATCQMITLWFSHFKFSFSTDYRRRGILTFLLHVPLLVALLFFTSSQQTMPYHFVKNWDFLQRLLIKGTSFQCYSTQEVWVLFPFMLIILLSIFTLLIVRIRGEKKLKSHDGLLLSIPFYLLMYLFVPTDYACQLLEPRLQVYIVLILFYWLNVELVSKTFIKLLRVIFFGMMLALFVIRFPVIQQQDAAMKEWMTLDTWLPEHALVLPLNFKQSGIDEKGQDINNRSDIFIHAADYLGVRKNLLLLDNYEAHLSWFPLRFKEAINPYLHLCSNASIESNRPSCQLEAYAPKAHQSIDYIIYYGFETKVLKDPATAAMHQDVWRLYTQIYVSPSGHVQLYKIK